jgi:hypothetical protein
MTFLFFLIVSGDPPELRLSLDCSWFFDLDQLLLWLVVAWQIGTRGQQWVDCFGWISLAFHSQQEWGRMRRKVEHVTPHCPFAVAFVHSVHAYRNPFLLPSRRPWERVTGFPWLPQRSQDERLDNLGSPSGATSYQLTCLDLWLLTNTSFVFSAETVRA